MKMKAKYIDMDAGEYTAVLHDDDCLELGVNEQDRIKLKFKGKEVTAIVQTTDTIVQPGEVGILENAFRALEIEADDQLEVVYTAKPDSVSYIRKKMEGKKLMENEIRALISDISNNRLSQVEMSAYITSLFINGMDVEETTGLIRAMVESGETIDFEGESVFDFHSVGGCPGNKITLLVVPIVAAAGLLIPKTSSRAISSAGGTADIVEVLTNVSFDAKELKVIAEKVGGTMAWGGSMNLAPADDMIIKVEYALGVDPHAQLLGSVMSKKKAVGANFLVIDIPMGEGTKVETYQQARAYARDFIDLGEELDMKVECAITYGGQPVGRAVGPALEAREALSILEGANHPNSVISKSTSLAGMLLEMGGIVPGEEKAMGLLNSGKALDKFKEIIEAQGGDPDICSEDIQVGNYREELQSKVCGYVNGIDNRGIVKIARQAGAPGDKGAGIVIHKKKGNRVDKGEPLCTIYADNKTKLERAVSVGRNIDPFTIEGMVLAKVPSYEKIH